MLFTRSCSSLHLKKNPLDKDSYVLPKYWFKEIISASFIIICFFWQHQPQYAPGQTRKLERTPEMVLSWFRTYLGFITYKQAIMYLNHPNDTWKPPWLNPWTSPVFKNLSFSSQIKALTKSAFYHLNANKT